MRCGRGLSITLAFLVLMTPFGAGAAVVWNYHTWLSYDTGSGLKRSGDNQFGCDDLIYLFVRSENDALVGRKLSTEWENVSSGIRHKTSREFQKTRDGKAYWSWGGIEFTGGTGGPLERLTGLLDPVAGREDIIGKWRISARVDDLYQKDLDMVVLC